MTDAGNIVGIAVIFAGAMAWCELGPRVLAWLS